MYYKIMAELQILFGNYVVALYLIVYITCILCHYRNSAVSKGQEDKNLIYTKIFWTDKKMFMRDDKLYAILNCQ